MKNREKEARKPHKEDKRKEGVREIWLGYSSRS